MREHKLRIPPSIIRHRQKRNEDNKNTRCRPIDTQLIDKIEIF